MRGRLHRLRRGLLRGERCLQPWATDAQWIRKITTKDKQTDVTQAFPVMCQHCEYPPCVDV